MRVLTTSANGLPHGDRAPSALFHLYQERG
jgi:hypothetical protein